jgi:hypothetical protein
VVVPEAQDVLLGALPLEGMDLIVDPVRKTLAAPTAICRYTSSIK